MSLSEEFSDDLRVAQKTITSAVLLYRQGDTPSTVLFLREKLNEWSELGPLRFNRLVNMMVGQAVVRLSGSIDDDIEDHLYEWLEKETSHE